MTSLYDRIQTLGNRMATNLQKMGVSASFSDGGLTLADKILEINRFTDGIFISSDKSIGQSSDTIRLSALVLEDGNYKKNQAIVFQDENSEHQTINPSDGTTDFKVLTNSNVFCGADLAINFKDSTNRYWLNYNTGTGVARLYDTSIGGNEILSFSGGDHLISFNNGVFSSNGHSLDASQYFTSVKFHSVSQTSLSSVLVYYGILGYGVTGNDGVVSIQYTCSGAGNKEITATDGSVQSEIYEVQDLLAYDTGINGTETNLYSVSGGLTKTVGSDGTLFSVSNGTSPTINFLDKSGTQYYLPTTPFEVNFDVVSQDVSLLVYYTDQDSHYGSISMNNGFSVGHTVKLKYNGSKIQLFYDDTASTSANVTFTSKARIYIIKAWGSGQSFNLKIKNFKAYPI